eukprot:1158857-Pelagomonas_calceolata.AAC.3
MYDAGKNLSVLAKAAAASIACGKERKRSDAQRIVSNTVATTADPLQTHLGNWRADDKHLNLLQLSCPSKQPSMCHRLGNVSGILCTAPDLFSCADSPVAHPSPFIRLASS